MTAGVQRDAHSSRIELSPALFFRHLFQAKNVPVELAHGFHLPGK